MKLITKRSHTSKVLGVVCMIRTGSIYEPASKSGLAGLVQSLLLKGTEDKNAAELALALEKEGISLNTDVSEDYVTVTAAAMQDQLPELLSLMREVIFHPTFPPDEIEKEKKNAIASIYLREDSKFHLVYKKLRSIMFEGSNYSRLPEGTPETIMSITREDITSFHEQFYQPTNMILSIVGNIPTDEIREEADRHFADVPVKVVEFIVSSKSKPPLPRREVIEKEVEQGFIVMGFHGIPMTDEDYPSLRLASTIMGEGMSSRLFTHLRDKQGLAYAVGSLYLNLAKKGALLGYIGTRPESIENARTRMYNLFRDLEAQPIPEDELERAKNYLVGNFLIAHQTNIKKAFYLAWFDFLGLGVEFDEKYPSIIEAVKEDEVRSAARQYLRTPCIVTLQPESKSKEK